MANIGPYVSNIRTAVYGEEVRGSIADAITAINTESESSKATANAASATASAAATVVGGYAGIEHRNHYRGKNLGTSITDAQKTAISSGTFDDIFIGDYWNINNVIWIVADIDYWMNVGDTNFNKHHLVITPSNASVNAESAVRMHSTNDTSGGYANTELRSTGLSNWRSKFSSAFGNMLLTHREVLTTEAVDGIPTKSSWFDVDVDIPEATMILGYPLERYLIPSASGMTAFNSAPYGQLAICRLNQPIIIGRVGFWFRDILSTGTFGAMNAYKSIYAAVATSDAYYRIRPFAAIGVNS